MRKRIPVLVLTAFAAGCASILTDSDCELEPAELEVLKQRALAFLDSKWAPEGSVCEEIMDFTMYVRGHGCGIPGAPVDSSRPGCPDTLHGEYLVIFDRETLEPDDIVLIVY